jgi:hypothetical protein
MDSEDDPKNHAVEDFGDLGDSFASNSLGLLPRNSACTLCNTGLPGNSCNAELRNGGLKTHGVNDISEVV